MKRKARSGKALVTLVLFNGLLSGGCTMVDPVSPEEQVGARAVEWANALMRLDFDEAVTYMTPAYQNSPRSSRFKGEFSGAGSWKGAELKSVTCDSQPVEDGVCVVRLILTVVHPPAIATPLPIPYDSVWRYINDEWYMLRD